jgi:hypothetical protein
MTVLDPDGLHEQVGDDRTDLLKPRFPQRYGTLAGLRACPHPVTAVVSMAYSTSPSCSDTANTAMPSSPSIAVALLLLFTWGLPVRVC